MARSRNFLPSRARSTARWPGPHTGLSVASLLSTCFAPPGHGYPSSEPIDVRFLDASPVGCSQNLGGNSQSLYRTRSRVPNLPGVFHDRAVAGELARAGHVD